MYQQIWLDKRREAKRISKEDKAVLETFDQWHEAFRKKYHDTAKVLDERYGEQK